jgi:hypothetical protein
MRPGRRREDLAADKTSRHARRSSRAALYTGDDFNYAELIAGRKGLQHDALSAFSSAAMARL